MDDRRRANVRARVAKYGIWVQCARCAFEHRHRQQDGRLRDARCPVRFGERTCGGELRARSWIEAYPDRWQELVKRTTDRLAPFWH